MRSLLALSLLPALAHGFLMPTSAASRGARAGGVCMEGERKANFAASALAVAAALSLGSEMAFAVGTASRYSLPGIDFTDPDRCTFKSSSIGQANAQRDQLYDLRQCVLSKANAAGFDLSGALFAEGDFSGANFRDAQLSKAYAKKGNFRGADFTNAIVDRAFFDQADMEGALFNNAVLTGSTFRRANMKDVDFTDVYIGQFDLKDLCQNPTVTGTNPKTGADTRESLGCTD
mmetsp:Transcript_20360/g.69146  ORF Transcript_20360/g.69146 Transcript_20360/m.69146 type:complete len:232 (-) Transcript_20360:107-802(-)